MRETIEHERDTLSARVKELEKDKERPDLAGEITRNTLASNVP